MDEDRWIETPFWSQLNNGKKQLRWRWAIGVNGYLIYDPRGGLSNGLSPTRFVSPRWQKLTNPSRGKQCRQWSDNIKDDNVKDSTGRSSEECMAVARERERERERD